MVVGVLGCYLIYCLFDYEKGLVCGVVFLIMSEVV